MGRLELKGKKLGCGPNVTGYGFVFGLSIQMRFCPPALQRCAVMWVVVVRGKDGFHRQQSKAK